MYARVTIFSVKNAPDTAVLDEFCEGNVLILPVPLKDEDCTVHFNSEFTKENPVIY